MTPEELAHACLVPISESVYRMVPETVWGYLKSRIADVIRRERLEEREENARTAESVGTISFPRKVDDIGHDIAAAIRQRPAP